MLLLLLRDTFPPRHVKIHSWTGRYYEQLYSGTKACVTPGVTRGAFCDRPVLSILGRYPPRPHRANANSFPWGRWSPARGQRDWGWAMLGLPVNCRLRASGMASLPGPQMRSRHRGRDDVGLGCVGSGQDFDVAIRAGKLKKLTPRPATRATRISDFQDFTRAVAPEILPNEPGRGGAGNVLNNAELPFPGQRKHQ